MRKADVRALATENGIRTAGKADSQEICFVPSNDYRKLLDEHDVPLHAGRIVDTSGKPLGRHAGTEHFTIGQRRGLGVASTEPLYVCRAPHRLPGPWCLVRAPSARSHGMELEQPNFIGFEPPASGEFRAHVQVRYHHDAAAATITLADGGAQVEFDEPQLAIAPGQGAAFYDGDRLLGGAWIASAPTTGSKAFADALEVSDPS